MPGFGVMPFGTGPMGLGTPVSASEPPVGPAGCLYINPATKDYEQDPETGQLKQMPPVRQQVLLAITTLTGSATTLDWLGIRLPRKMGDRFQGDIEVSVRAALRHLTDTQKIIRVDSIVAQRGAGGRARITVSWTDLTTKLTDQVSNFNPNP
ncbi:MAG TPA: hypothetical protein VL494_13745 [Steroidobacteraceae bacterium]|jgi:hypothetical protein|nr:hypothetical protein [Steroidobacteraceae bacterium]